uniref:Uncharacterized protein n=1 Tax=Anguilla anguilla TaxID=7936 RepID=A0A0E9RS63_ANGAN
MYTCLTSPLLITTITHCGCPFLKIKYSRIFIERLVLQ